MTDSMIYGNDYERLEGDANLFLCKLYEVRGIIDEEKNALDIFRSLHQSGISDEEQATKDIIHQISLQVRVTKIEGKAGFIKLTHEGLT